ncbi:endonuclease/exonuclease/phosphatase family protein [Streptomyces sp. SBT349]|uniref:endonuclease/exonuclease/phosphatase family protein n=1 Tax=Streptomyces sp. SBT349 TaxID=1580539 RepID=UPI00066C18D6|nr:endonuclease/exonuclease/phosphatase family protein [Streptomyces sp. SBT349]
MNAARTPPLAVAVTTLAGLELLRLAGASGSIWAVLPALLAAALAGPLVWWSGPRPALPAALAALGAARLLVQIPGARTVPVLAVAAGVAVAALVVAVRRCAATSGNGPGRAARAIALAVGADVATRLPFDLLDPAWRGGATGWLWALACAAALGALAADTYRRPAPVARPGGGAELALLGPALALYALLLASPAAVAAQGGGGLTGAGLWIAAGTVLGVAALSAPQPRWAAPAALAAAVAAFTLLPPLAGIAALAGTAALPSVLRRVLRTRPLTTGQGALPDLALAGAGGVLGHLLLAVPYQLRTAPAAFALLTALLLAGAAYAARAADRERAGARFGRPFLPVVLATVLLAAPPLAGALRSAPEPLPTDTAGGMYRLMTWNVHAAVDERGELAPEAVLDTIRASDAQVVALQEVPRGWPGAGGLDLAAWLERRLDVTAVWAPSADRHFGNLVLTSLPVLDSATTDLPRAGGDMDRSAATLTLGLADGEEVRVVATHLDGRSSPDARLRQLEGVLREAEDGGPATVLAGDLNARPGSREIERVTEAGFHSAQDTVGDPDRDTATVPPRRVDWIFGASGVAFGDFTLEDTTASDHRPLVVTVYLD